MTRVRCPQKSCIFWLGGWCDSDEIELAPNSLSCLTFEEMEVDVPEGAVLDVDDEEQLDWIDEESLFEEELDESLYGYEDDLDEFDEDDLVAEEDDDWSF